MNVYYKITKGDAHRAYFTNSVYMNEKTDLFGFSLLYKCRVRYANFVNDNRVNMYLIIPLSLEEINDTIEKYGCLL